MYLTGFTDEAGKSLIEQINATKKLGWNHLSIRNIDGVNIHELKEKKFNQVLIQLEENNIQVAELGSLIANWGKSISSPFDITLREVERAIPRMKKLNCNIVRIMSYKQESWGKDQQEKERFRRLREITKRFHNAGIIVAHENCMNWGGFSAQHTLRLIEEVPHLKLIFDTGNPVFQRDRSKQEPHPWQSAYEFYQKVKEHIIHIHIKDCIMENEQGEPLYVFPGEGQGDIKKILIDLRNNDYQRGIAIEPHVATVFHMKEGETVNWQKCFESYVTYGKQLEKLLNNINYKKIK